MPSPKRKPHPNSRSNLQPKSLGSKRKLLFSLGDITSSLPLAIQMFFQLYFLTDVARLTPASAGWVLGVARAWDAVNDPIVGLISDRIRSRHGRRRVLLMYGSIPLGLFFAASWLVPFSNESLLVVYYALALIAFDTAFTIVHVGYNALTPGMTSDYDERSSLNGYRMCVSLCGTIGAISYATLLDQFIDRETTRFALLGISLGLVSAIPPWIVLSVTSEPLPELVQANLSISASIRATVMNRAFIFLMAIYLTSWTAASILASMLVYLARYYFLVPGQANYFVLVAQGSAIVFVPISVWLARTFDKPKAYLVGVTPWCFVLAAIASLDQNSLTWAYICAALCGPGIATALVIPWSMVPDIIEDDELRTGERREGTYYSLVAFFQKLGTGLALWGVGQSLTVSGYVTPSDSLPVPVQPETVLRMMRIIIGPLTIGLLVLSLPIAWFYPIDRESHNERVKALSTSDKRR